MPVDSQGSAPDLEVVLHQETAAGPGFAGERRKVFGTSMYLPYNVGTRKGAVCAPNSASKKRHTGKGHSAADRVFPD